MSGEMTEQETLEGLGQFSFTTKFINDELDLIQTQQENIVSLASQLDQALSRAEYVKKLIKVMKKTDKIILAGLSFKRKKESRTIRMIEDLKALLAQKRYEDIDRYLASIRQESRTKVRLSEEQLNKLRDLMNEINMLYQEAAGFCRLSQAIYARLATIYGDCEQELNKELNEEETLNKAGTGQNKLLQPETLKNNVYLH